MTAARCLRPSPRGRTGPRSLSGRKKASRNSLLHGLSVPPHLDPQLEAKTEARARLLTERHSNPFVRSAAFEVARAELELDRISEARRHLFRQAFSVEGKAAKRETDYNARIDWVNASATDLLRLIHRHLADPKLSVRHRRQLEQQKLWYAAAASAEAHLQPEKKKPIEQRYTELSFSVEWLIPRLRRPRPLFKTSSRSIPQGNGNLAAIAFLLCYLKMLIVSTQSVRVNLQNEQIGPEADFCEYRN